MRSEQSKDSEQHTAAQDLADARRQRCRGLAVAWPWPAASLW